MPPLTGTRYRLVIVLATVAIVIGIALALGVPRLFAAQRNAIAQSATACAERGPIRLQLDAEGEWRATSAGENAACTDAADVSRRLYEVIDDARDETERAGLLRAYAKIQATRGDFQDAIAAIRRAGELYSGLGEADTELRCLIDELNWLRALGELELATEGARRLLADPPAAMDAQREATLLLLRADAALARYAQLPAWLQSRESQTLRSAEDTYTQAAALLPETADPREQTPALTDAAEAGLLRTREILRVGADRMGNVIGSVAVDGRPGSSVSLRFRLKDGPEFQATSNSAGAFAFRLLPPGKYTIALDLPLAGAARTEDLTVEGAEPFTLYSSQQKLLLIAVSGYR